MKLLPLWFKDVKLLPFWFKLVWCVVTIIAVWRVLDCYQAFGQCTPSGCPPAAVQVQAQQQNPAIVRVGHGPYFGSGTIVGRKNGGAYVLTAAHVCRGPGKTVVIIKGKRYAAKVLKSERSDDVLLLGIADPGIEPIRFADKLPVPGDRLAVGGYGTRGVYRLSLGNALKYVSFDDGRTFNAIESSARARDGDSGGPILNSRGRLVAVQSCGDARSPSIGTCFPRIKAILRGVLPPYPRRPGWVIPKRPRRVVSIAPPPRTAPVWVRPDGPIERPAPPGAPLVAPRAEPMNIPPPQIAALEERVAALEELLRGKLFTAQVKTASGQIETEEISLGGTLSLTFSPIPEEK